MSETTELQRAVENLTKGIESLRQELVRKDVYEVNERARDAAYLTLRSEVQGITVRLDKAEERRAADRRLIIASFVAPFLLLVLNLYIATQTGGHP